MCQLSGIHTLITRWNNQVHPVEPLEALFQMMYFLPYLQTYSNQFKYQIKIIPTKAQDLSPIITFITTYSIQYINPLNNLGHFEFKQLFPSSHQREGN